MTPPLRKLYKEAISNKTYMAMLRASDPDVPKYINVFTSELVKMFIAVAYEGYLIALNRFDNDKYF